MKKINIHATIWFGILILFASYIYHLFETENIYTYVHPKMFKYLYFTFIFLILLGIFQFRKIFHVEENVKGIWGLLIFLIPLCLSLISPSNELNGRVLSNKSVDISSAPTTQDKLNTEDSTSYLQDSMNFEDIYSSVEGESFINVLDNVYGNLNNITGKEVKLLGFVYRKEGLSQTQFIISRLMMICCAADAQISGVLCEYEKASSLKGNAWIEITGIVDQTIYSDAQHQSDEKIPIIKVTKVKEVSKPKNVYIYP